MMADAFAPKGRGQDVASGVKDQLEKQLQRHEAIRDLRISITLKESGINVDWASAKDENGDGKHTLNQTRKSAISELIRRNSFSLEDVVRLLRGESASDPRPNKAMDPERYRRLLSGYEHLERMVAAATKGLDTQWRARPDGKGTRHKNHQSAVRYSKAVRRSVREGQDSGTYIVLDLDILQRWPEVTTSPFSAVEKKGEDPCDVCRLVHDLSCPRDDSTNSDTVQDELPAICCRAVTELALRIEDLARRFPGVRILMMSGDVKSAYRHLMNCACQVHRMAGQLPNDDALIIDVSAPFGWTASPAYYGMYGRAITWLMSRESPATMSGSSGDGECFFGYEWVDDHVLIEPDTGQRTHWADQALRLAMLAVLGPRSVNEKKFTKWSTQLRVLGLEFDTERRTVSMPTDKIEKALGRVKETQKSPCTTKSALRKLLGSLRHIATCLPSSKPFFQSLQAAANSAPDLGRTRLSAGACLDLKWFAWILSHGQLRGLPTSMFAKQSSPDVHLYMDASNDGLVVLDPDHRRFIQVKFDDEEQLWIQQLQDGGPTASAFNINVREHLCLAFAAVLWGHTWCDAGPARLAHVHCWSDNTSAVAWTNSKASRNSYAQELNRAIGLHEAVHGFRMHAQHLPGEINTMADAGSRACATSGAQDLQDILHELQSAALAKSSKRKYDATWQQWEQWCSSRGFPVVLPPATEDHSLQLILFGIECWRDGNSANTVLSKISHVSWHHQVRVGYQVKLHAGHRLAMQGMQRLSPPPRSKRPATKPLLRRLRDACDFSRAHDRVLWGAAVMGFFFLLRKSEYVSDGNKRQWFMLSYDDIQCTDKHGFKALQPQDASHVQVRLRGSKTDQHGKTTMLKHAATSDWLCPVQAAWELLRHGARLGMQGSAPLCSVSATKTITANELKTAIKKAARAIGEDPAQFGTHSMRSGGATAMFGGGIDMLTIKKFGRWRSDCVETYAVLHDACIATLSSHMVGSTGQSAQGPSRDPPSRSPPAPGWGPTSTPAPIRGNEVARRIAKSNILGDTPSGVLSRKSGFSEGVPVENRFSANTDRVGVQLQGPRIAPAPSARASTLQSHTRLQAAASVGPAKSHSTQAHQPARTQASRSHAHVIAPANGNGVGAQQGRHSLAPRQAKHK